MSETPVQKAYPNESSETQLRIEELCYTFEIDPMRKPYRVLTQNGKRKLFLSAAGYDMVAFSTNQYLGSDETEFGPDKLFSKKVNGVLVEELIPEYAKQTVYRHTPNGTATFVAKIYAREYINDLKHVRNPHMFMDKWVHCVVMRKAFADQIGSEVAAEELDAKMDFTKGDVGTVELKDVLYPPIAEGNFNAALTSGYAQVKDLLVPPTAECSFNTDLSSGYAQVLELIPSPSSPTVAVPSLPKLAKDPKQDVAQLIAEVFG